MKSKKGGYTTGGTANNPFAALLKGVSRDDLPTGGEGAAGGGDSPASVQEPKRTFRVHVERKGRKGKTVTLVKVTPWEQEWSIRQGKAWGKKLGCGSFVEEGQIGFQGDHREAIQKWIDALQEESGGAPKG